MRYVDNWLNYHHFHHQDVVEFKEILKNGWETLLLVALVAMLLYTMIVLVAPDLAFDISRFFI